MTSLRLYLAMLIIVAALYRFVQVSDEADLCSTLQVEGCKLRASSLLSLAFQRRLSAMEKADRKVWSQFAKFYSQTIINWSSVSPSEKQQCCLAEATAAVCWRHRA